MIENEITHVFDQLTALGFRLDPSESRIVGSQVLLSHLAQVGLHLHGFEDTSADPMAPHAILLAMRDYASNHFEIQQIKIGPSTSFELNHQEYTFKWDALGADFIHEINTALHQAQSPFRWVWVEAYEPHSSPDYASSLLFLPLTVIAGLALAFVDDAEYLFEQYDLEEMLVFEPPLAPDFDFNKTVTITYKEFVPNKIPQHLIFHFNAKGFYHPRDYEPVLRGALGLTNRQLEQETLTIHALDNRSCEATIRIGENRIKGILLLDKWVDGDGLLEFLNSAAEALGIHERFWELNTKDQSMKLTFMTYSDFSLHHNLDSSVQDTVTTDPPVEKGFFESILAFFKRKG